jgi:hypothetical protein
VANDAYAPHDLAPVFGIQQIAGAHLSLESGNQASGIATGGNYLDVIARHQGVHHVAAEKSGCSRDQNHSF